MELTCTLGENVWLLIIMYLNLNFMNITMLGKYRVLLITSFHIMGLKVFSYNCRGLPKDGSKLALRPDIKDLFESCHIIGLQETHYSLQDLKGLNCIHNSFVGVGVSKIDESKCIIQGRYSGGVALLWRN